MLVQLNKLRNPGSHVRPRRVASNLGLPLNINGRFYSAMMLRRCDRNQLRTGSPSRVIEQELIAVEDAERGRRDLPEPALENRRSRSRICRDDTESTIDGRLRRGVDVSWTSDGRGGGRRGSPARAPPTHTEHISRIALVRLPKEEVARGLAAVAQRRVHSPGSIALSTWRSGRWTLLIFRHRERGSSSTHFLVVSDQDRSREFYKSLFDGKVLLERDPVIMKVANTWLILNNGGGPTDDKPTVTLTTPPDANRTSAILNLRVADIQKAYADWSARGAEFLTEPKDHGREIRAYIRDPDGHLIEVGQATGVLG